jgi:RNA recognition motif-containing protein
MSESKSVSPSPSEEKYRNKHNSSLTTNDDLSDAKKPIFIGNIDIPVTPQELSKAFSRYGTVSNFSFFFHQFY